MTIKANDSICSPLLKTSADVFAFIWTKETLSNSSIIWPMWLIIWKSRC